MLDVMLCFHIHQPYRLCKVRFFDRNAELFDDVLNRAVLEKVSRHCYTPASDLLYTLAKCNGADFKCAFSITGTAVEQLKMWNPEALDRLRRLVATESVELMGETYFHSLFSLFDREEFIDQVDLHTEMTKHEFSVRPYVFRNTELLYDDAVSDYLSCFDQFRVLLCEDAAVDDAAGATPCTSYNGLHFLLFRDHTLSDDIAFRFRGSGNCDLSLTPKLFASELIKREDIFHEGDSPVVLLYVDYETLGEHYSEKSGIFTFFKDLAEIILNSAQMRFSRPSDCLDRPGKQMRRVSVRRPVSWADSGKNLSAWLSSDLQKNAMNTLLELWTGLKRRGDEQILKMVRRLSSSDHFYYMYPWNGGADAEVHRCFSPYDSPEDAYMRYMAALAALELRLS